MKELKLNENEIEFIVDLIHEVCYEYDGFVTRFPKEAVHDKEYWINNINKCESLINKLKGESK